MTDTDNSSLRRLLARLVTSFAVVHMSCFFHSVARAETGDKNYLSSLASDVAEDKLPQAQTSKEQVTACIDALRESFLGVHCLRIESRTTSFGDFGSFKNGQVYKRVFTVRMSPLSIHEHTISETDTTYSFTCMTNLARQSQSLNTQEGKTSKTDASAVGLPPIHLGLPGIDALRILGSSDAAEGGVTHGSTVKLKSLLFSKPEELPQFAVENVTGKTIVAMVSGVTSEESEVRPLVLARYIPTSYFGYEVGERVRDWRLYGDEQVLLPSYFVTWIRQPGDKHPRIVAATEVLSVEINGELDQSVFED